MKRVKKIILIGNTHDSTYDDGNNNGSKSNSFFVHEWNLRKEMK